MDIKTRRDASRGRKSKAGGEKIKSDSRIHTPVFYESSRSRFPPPSSQACTGIEDIESAIEILEANNWNLLDSINAVMPHLGSQSLPSEDGPGK